MSPASGPVLVPKTCCLDSVRFLPRALTAFIVGGNDDDVV